MDPREHDQGTTQGQASKWDGNLWRKRIVCIEYCQRERLRVWRRPDAPCRPVEVHQAIHQEKRGYHHSGTLFRLFFHLSLHKVSQVVSEHDHFLLTDSQEAKKLRSNWLTCSG